MFLEPFHNEHEFVEKSLLAEVLPGNVLGGVVGNHLQVIRRHQTEERAQKVENLLKKPNIGFLVRHAGKIHLRMKAPGADHLAAGSAIGEEVIKIGEHNGLKRTRSGAVRLRINHHLICKSGISALDEARAS